MEQDEKDYQLNGYGLSRQWFDFAFENPNLVNTNHCALWFWIVDLCNRLGWKEKFGLPTVLTMEALGLKSYNTFKATLYDLISFEFISLIEKSKNQYTTNIIAISNFNKAHYKALDKALVKAPTKYRTKQNDIDKQGNKRINPTNPTTNLPDAFSTGYTPINVFDSLAYKLWKQCIDNRQAKMIRPTTLLNAKPKIWADHIRLMIERDGRTEAEIIEVLNYLPIDEFWPDNILSTEKLRIKFETLQSKMRTPKYKRRLSSQQDLSNLDYKNKNV